MGGIDDTVHGGMASMPTSAMSTAAPISPAPPGPVSDIALQRQELWGGSCTLTVPASYIDASQVRPINDNQEVYFADNGSCLIAEIMEPPALSSSAPDATGPGGIAHTHAQDIASCNSNDPPRFLLFKPDVASHEAQPQSQSQSPPALALVRETIAHLQSIDPAVVWDFSLHAHVSEGCRQVWTFLLVWRLPSKSSDVLISWSLPWPVDRAPQTLTDFPEDLAAYLATFLQIASSFRINDPHLFDTD